jgi:O-antigen/teichoic acid export membrane protein
MAGMIRRVGLYGVATVLPSAVTFLFLPILTRQMPKSDFGTMSALTALYNLFFLAFTLYLDRSLGRLYFLYEGEARKDLIGSLFLSILAVATCGLLLTFGLSPLFERVYPEISARRFAWYGASVYFTVIIYFARTYYTSAERPTPYLWLSLSVSAATVLGMYWFVVIRQEGIDGWLKALIFSNAAIAVPAALFVARACTLRIRWNMVRDALVYAGPMIPTFFCYWLSGSVDRLLVGRWTGMTSNALYGAASQLGNILQLAFLPVFMTYQPVFFRLSTGGVEERRTVLACNRALMLLIGVASCLLISVAPLLAGTVLPASYIGVSGNFAWLVVAGCFTQAAGIPTAGLYHCRRTDLVFYTYALEALVAIGADFALIPKMGRDGAVIGQLLSNAAAAAALFVLGRRTYGKLIEPVFLCQSLGAVVAMGVLAETQARGRYVVASILLQFGVLAVLGTLGWGQRQDLREILAKNLWQSRESVPQPAI